MSSPEEIDARINEINARKEEVLRDMEEKTRDKEQMEQTLQGEVPEEEKTDMQQTVDGLTSTIDNYKQELSSLSEELKKLNAAKEPPEAASAQERESIIKIKSNIQTELNRLEEEMKKSDTDREKAAAEIPVLNELLATKSEKKLRDWDRQYQQQQIAVMPALVEPTSGAAPARGGAAPAGQGSSPPVPPPTPDGGGRKPPPSSTDFPLYDSAVLIELREADERANKASKAIEAVREQLAAYAKKDEMTPEDIKMMEEKQKELMDKMAEFEEITKRVQHLVGLVDVASSQLGPPQRPMVPVVEGVRTAGPGQTARPEDTLPKVIVCGTGDVDQVPKIIVCEPRKARDGKAPLYHQLEGKPRSKPGSGEGSREFSSAKRCPPTCAGPSGGGMPTSGPFANYPGFGPGQIGMGMGPPGMTGMYGPPMGGMGGPPMGGMGGPPMGGMGGPPMGGMGGPPMCCMGGPQPGYMPGLMPPGTPPGMMMGSFGPPSPCPCRSKKKRSGKHKDQETEVYSGELERRLEASLNMSEMLADQNTKLEGSRYELQEAVLDKDKQHDALMVELQNLKLELQSCKNENKDLKTQACNKGSGRGTEIEKGSANTRCCMEGMQQGGKKPGAGGLCKKELRTMPICRAQAYKEMGLPLPRNEIRPQCPGAKFAASMGWNENQGCRNELQKSVNCPDMKGPNSNPCPGQPGCLCSSKGPQACPVHKGCPSQGPKPQMMGSGDRAHNPQCPCGCMAPAGQCKRADMVFGEWGYDEKCLKIMSSHDTRRRLPNDGRRAQSASNERPSFPQPDGSVKDPNRGRPGRPASDQGKRPRALQLMESAQKQLQALSQLTNKPSSGQSLRRGQQQSRSSSSSGRSPRDILPDKTKFECLQQMSELLRRNYVKPKNVDAPLSHSNHKPSTPVKPKYSERIEIPEFRELIHHDASRRDIRGVSQKEKSEEKSPPDKRGSQLLGDAQFEYVHEIIKKSSALTRNATPPHALRGTAPPPDYQKTKNDSYNRKISEIMKTGKEQQRPRRTGMPSSKNGKPLSPGVLQGRSSNMTSKIVQNKITENLLRAGPPQGSKASLGQSRYTPQEAIVQTMEQEVKSLQNELELVQAERRGLALQKKLLNCMAEASGAPGPSGPVGCSAGGGGGGGGPPSGARAMDGPPPNKPLVLLKKAMPDNLSTVELQLNSLREQYRKLQEDFNAKVEEVSMVRVEYEAAKRDALSLQDKCREAEARVDDLLERLRVIELEKTKMAGSKDQMMELEQQLTMAKQRYREGQEELEEIKTTMQDQMLQLEEYRNKYLSAQQTVEEQRRQIDIMELENNRISEQVNLEIQRVKNQFQEKLTELTPLPDMLKATQMKLQECDQLRQLAERNVEQLLNQSDELKDQNKKLESELEELRKHTATQAGEKESLTRGLSTGEKKIEEIKSENNKLRATVKRLEEVALNNDRRLDEKNHEVLQLQTQLETLREESARQVSRTKDRCEAVRRTLQGQISQLECQLAQSRAAARTAQKDRDEIRQRMQAQITSLNDNFEQAQLRIRSLQSHVNYLKSSYTNIFAPEQCTPIGPKPIDGLSTC